MTQPSALGKSHDATVPAMSASWKIVTPAASVLVQDRTTASAEEDTASAQEEAESIRTWQYLAQKRCSRPSILFWYLRVGCAGLLTYATLRRGVIRRLTNGKVRRLAMIALVLAYRLMRRPKQIFRGGISDIEDAFAKFKSPRVGGRFVNHDGVDIAYTTLGCGPKLVLLANGIGCRDVYFVQILQYFDSIGANTEYTMVTWDYRGLFHSGELPDKRTARFSMRDHAEDALELLGHLGGGSCHAALGWSTGVQVLLEMAAIKPNVIGRLVLVNGAHGHVFQSVAQPIMRVPGFCYIAHSLTQLFRHPKVMPIAMSLYGSCLPIFRTCLLRPMAFMLGINYEAFFHNYLKEVVMYGEKHTANYLKLAACLDAHSCYHVLDEIRQPTLIFAGMLDVLTPAYHSFEMAARMPNAKLVCYNFGSHFCALEYASEMSKLGEVFLKVPVEALLK